MHKISIEGKNWCKILDMPIEVELVCDIKPPCIEEKNGCGNCENSEYRVKTEVV